ncbi:MAG: hypothetical protein KDC10_01500 [Calditrichaeota bacterium]|nr:hypothetical protein [Candidatus Cloacimonadota bacterium]MCB1045848.1 hypothetical protein [Calditrichota bacterium]
MSATDRRQALGRLGAVLAGLFALGPLGLLRSGAPRSSAGQETTGSGNGTGDRPQLSLQVRPAEKAVKRNV